MKRLLFGVLLLCSCGLDHRSDYDATPTKEKAAAIADAIRAEDLIREQQTKPLTAKAALLGFELGASRTETQFQLMMLGRQGKIKLEPVNDSEGAFYYYPRSSGEVSRSLLAFDWAGDKLAKVSFTFLTDCSEELQKDVIKDLTQKYGKPTLAYVSDKGDKHTVWLDGGRKIDVLCEGTLQAVEYSAEGLLSQSDL